jgi:predicted dehydrogenase
VLAEFTSGATAQIATVRAAPMYWRLHVFGTRGWAEARDETTLTVAKVGGEPVARTFPPVDSLCVLLEAFAQSISTGTPFPVSTDEMLNVVAAFEASITSMKRGEAVRVAPL